MPPASETHEPGPPASPADFARYTAELVDSLRKMALRHGQPLLAHLLHLAVIEAKSQAEGGAQETRLPE